jgi:hypothetical protein
LLEQPAAASDTASTSRNALRMGVGLSFVFRLRIQKRCARPEEPMNLVALAPVRRVSHEAATDRRIGASRGVTVGNECMGWVMEHSTTDSAPP